MPETNVEEAHLGIGKGSKTPKLVCVYEAAVPNYLSETVSTGDTRRVKTCQNQAMPLALNWWPVWELPRAEPKFSLWVSPNLMGK